MSRDLWKLGVQWRGVRPDGNIRHSQLISTFGPGSLADLVDDAAIVSGLGWWSKGEPIVEDRLLTMLAKEPDFPEPEALRARLLRQHGTWTTRRASGSRRSASPNGSCARTTSAGTTPA